VVWSGSWLDSQLARELCKLATRVEQTGAHGLDTGSGELGDLLVRQSFNLEQREGLALLSRQRAEDRLDGAQRVAGLDAAFNVFSARGRFGYRHVFGPSVGLEVTVDGGPAVFQASFGNFSGGTLVGLVGGNYALVIAF